MFVTLVILLGAIAIAVPASRYLGLGSILGYLVAGAVIGPSGFGLITNVGEIGDVSALGVTMLLFLIGLELRPHRLWILRKAVFGMGLGQMLPTALLIACLTHLAGIAWPSAIVLGIGLALSSTAIVLPMLTERKLLPSVAGRDSFAVLLFQDMAAIPVLALEPLLAGAHVSGHAALFEFVRGLAVIAAILVGGSFLVRPLFRMVGYARSPEVFTATALLLVVGTAALADWAGLSASLGAFMAGVLVSDSEYRHELQADIEPFEGLLLGFFFMSVGMSADLSLSLHHESPHRVWRQLFPAPAAGAGHSLRPGTARGQRVQLRPVRFRRRHRRARPAVGRDRDAGGGVVDDADAGIICRLRAVHPAADRAPPGTGFRCAIGKGG
jgi:CPA2 family monovalent cation:H+ antiporter-2/glutathione-regulated potassium-efflux system protein KefB